jgi:hypothetical protein
VLVINRFHNPTFFSLDKEEARTRTSSTVVKEVK